MASVQIINNLVSNAIKYTPEGGSVRVHASAVPLADGRASVRIAVTDTGIGISAEAQAQLFRPFSQATAATTRKYGGTGLGLSISKRLVELMGGTIGCQSAEGAGSTFWCEMTLPLAPESEAVAKKAATKPRVRASGGVVLLADDNATNRLVLRSMCKRLGLQVIEAVDGVDAVAVWERERDRIGVVFMDSEFCTAAPHRTAWNDNSRSAHAAYGRPGRHAEDPRHRARAGAAARAHYCLHGLGAARGAPVVR